MVNPKIIIGIVSVVIVAVFVVIWYFFLRGNTTIGNLISKLINLILTPFRLILGLFGIGVAPAKPAGPDVLVSPDVNVTTHELGTCPPCDVKCAECPLPTDCKPYELEIKYLKDMVKFVGSMAQRENAINSQYRELYPGFSVMSPDVRRLSYEYNYLKNQLREDENEWTYFKNYFTKLSGIASTSSAIHYDLTF